MQHECIPIQLPQKIHLNFHHIEQKVESRKQENDISCHFEKKTSKALVIMIVYDKYTTLSSHVDGRAKVMVKA